MPTYYSMQFRENAVQKALTGYATKRQIADQMGIGLSTLQRWVRETQKSGEPTLDKYEKRPQDWTREERLNALLESAKLSEEELGAWCRKKGIHTHHLEKWRKAAKEMLTKTGLYQDPTFMKALSAVLEVLPPSEAFIGFTPADAVQPAANDFEALESLRRLAFPDSLVRPRQLSLWEY